MRLVSDLVSRRTGGHRCHERPVKQLRTRPFDGAPGPGRLAPRGSLRPCRAAPAGPRRPPTPLRLGGSTTIIDHLLRWAPANMRIAIAARVVPPLRLQRLRLDDRLTYLAHDELAFTAEESAEAVRAAGLDLDAGIVEARSTRHGGWPAGVRMAVLAARHGQRPADPTLSSARSGLRRLPGHRGPRLSPHDVRDFVLESCLDEQVCPSLIDNIRGTTTAEVLLEKCLADGALPLPR